jgi:hypothetical protein
MLRGIGGCQILLFIGLLATVGGQRQNDIREVDVFRMIQLEEMDQQRRGSQRSAVSLPAAPKTARQVSRQMVVLDFESATETQIQDLLVDRPAGAILIVLPESLDNISSEMRERWMQVESSLMNREIPMSVYFTFDKDQAKGLVNKVEQNTGDVHLVIPSDNVARVTKIEGTNYQGWLAGGGRSDDSSSSESLPTIAVVANYDSMGIAPGLAMGADSNGSGMIAVLELARLFSKLYSGARTRGRYNMMFVLTAAGKLNYAGTKQWLSYTDPRILDNTEFVLCLDSIGAGDKLHFHASKPLKDATFSKIFSTFSSVAAEMNIPLEHVHKKINISDTTVYWEHEQFSRKRILAATLSGQSKPDAAARTSILDTTIDHSTLMRNILFVANSLAKHIYGLSESGHIFNGSTAVQVLVACSHVSRIFAS